MPGFPAREAPRDALISLFSRFFCFFRPMRHDPGSAKGGAAARPHRPPPAGHQPWFGFMASSAADLIDDEADWTTPCAVVCMMEPSSLA